VTFIQVFIAVFIAAAAYFLFWTIIDLAGHAFPGLLDLMPLFVWSVAFCFSLWLLRSMDRQKLHHVLLTFLVVIAIAFITFYPLWLLLDARQFLFWKTLNAGSLGLGFIVLGLYDHIMLLRMMPKRIAEDDHDHE
jgi:hypothetical protein